MKNFIEYDENKVPYKTPEAERAVASCPSMGNGYACTRAEGHDGKHYADGCCGCCAEWEDGDDGE